VAWILTALLTKPTEEGVLVQFYKAIRPHGMGWKPVISAGKAQGILTNESEKTGRLATEILMMFLGCVSIYSLLFGTGYFIYGNMMLCSIFCVLTVVTAYLMKKFWSQIG